MFTASPTGLFYDDRAAAYMALLAELKQIIAGERDWLANSANGAALLYHGLPDLNWAEFYLYKNGGLVLGPFQGKPACVRIAAGRGVCGAAAASREAVVVADVHAFPGHISCDPASASELVVPLLLGDRLLGVIDLDSPVTGRFNAADAIGVRLIAENLVAGSDWAVFD